jgi:hypothetical protein
LALRFTQQIQSIERRDTAKVQRWVLTMVDGSKISMIVTKPDAAELVRTSEL